MKSDKIVAIRYAKALLGAAQSANMTRQVEEQLKVIETVVREDEKVRGFLFHPNIDASVKVDLLKQALPNTESQLVINTLQLLIERNRLSLLSNLIEYYVAVANETLGEADAVVFTPFELKEQERTILVDRFSQLTGKKIRLQQEIDPSLIGGVKVRIGDRVYDASLSGKLDRLSKIIIQG